MDEGDETEQSGKELAKAFGMCGFGKSVMAFSAEDDPLFAPIFSQAARLHLLSPLLTYFRFIPVGRLLCSFNIS